MISLQINLIKSQKNEKILDIHTKEIFDNRTKTISCIEKLYNDIEKYKIELIKFKEQLTEFNLTLTEKNNL